jgi:glycerate kinase
MGRVRVVVAPDSFGGTLSAEEAAEAIAAAWPAPHETHRVPLSDGGPGFLDALPGTRVTALVQDPLGRPVLAAFLLDGTTAYVEAAQAAGLHLLDPEERDPTRTSTAGVGELVRAALDAGATRVVVGLGGTATNDGGRGFVEALGDLEATGRPELVAATDVDNPLLGPDGATRVFGPQKGATGVQVEELELRLTAWADELEARTRPARDLAGAGAAGGLGFALLALGGGRVAGFDVVAAAVGLEELIRGADLVITGEGRLDGQSVRGKVVAGVSRLAAEHGVPCVAVAGEVLLGRREAGAAGLAATYALVDHDAAHARSDAPRVLREVAERVARAWGVAQ